MDILTYKDYEGTAELDMGRGMCRGKVLFIDDVVTYEADKPAELRKEFERAVDDYIATCKLLKREPKKPLKGQFNVRVPPDLHKAAALRAKADGVGLNDVVVRALRAFLNGRVEIHQTVEVRISEEELQTYVASGTEKPKWERLAYAN